LYFFSHFGIAVVVGVASVVSTSFGQLLHLFGHCSLTVSIWHKMSSKKAGSIWQRSLISSQSAKFSATGVLGASVVVVVVGAALPHTK